MSWLTAISVFAFMLLTLSSCGSSRAEQLEVDFTPPQQFAHGAERTERPLTWIDLEEPYLADLVATALDAMLFT